MMLCRHALACLLVLAVTAGRGIAQPPADAPATPPEDPEAALAAEIDSLIADLDLQPAVSAVLRTDFLEGGDAAIALLSLFLTEGDLQTMVPLFIRTLQPEVVPLSESTVLVVKGHTARVLSLATGELGKPISLGPPDAADRLLMLKAVRAARAVLEDAEEIGRQATLTAHLVTLQNAVDLSTTTWARSPGRSTR